MTLTLRNLIFATLVLAVPASSTFAKEITVRGKLQQTVEPGGWVINTGNEKYLILNKQKFQNEDWFKEQTSVEATGEIKDVMTTYMEGKPFEVRLMHPVQDRDATNSGPNPSGVTRVLVIGEAMVNAQPDTAVVTISVVTQNKSALSAQQENATKTDAVIRALKTAAGAAGEIKTSGYSVQPQRVYKESQPPTITGYEARNTVTLTLTDLQRVGAVLDSAAQAGANDFSGIAFTLHRDRSVREQALAEAARAAVTKAGVVASALGGRVVRILEVQEEGFVRPRPLEEPLAYNAGLANRAITPIQVGTLEITSRVQLIAEVQIR